MRVSATNTETRLPGDDMALVTARLAEYTTGLKKSSRYARAAAGTYPKPVVLSPRCSRYRAGDLRRWLDDPMGWKPSMAMDAHRQVH
jgi:prophage regulatory protein